MCGRATWVYVWCICDQYVAKFAVKCLNLSYLGVICGSGCGSGFWCWHALLVLCGRAICVYIDVWCICDHYVAKSAVIWIQIWIWIVFQNQEMTFRRPKEYACHIWCWLMQRCITYWWNKSVTEARCNLWIWIWIWIWIVFQNQEITLRRPKEYACQIWCWFGVDWCSGVSRIDETKVWRNHKRPVTEGRTNGRTDGRMEGIS